MTKAASLDGLLICAVRQAAPDILWQFPGTMTGASDCFTSSSGCMAGHGTKRPSERLAASAATNRKSDVQQWLAD